MRNAIKSDEHYTYAEYAEWDDGERYELIDGVPYLMSPAPSINHQRIAGRLYAELLAFLEDKPCEVLISPVDVRLNADEGDDTVVQPDVMVVCDDEKISDKSVNGAPDIVVEVISPSSVNYDNVAKLDIYITAGVRECWIINPEARNVRICDGSNITKLYQEDSVIMSNVLPGFAIPVANLFPHR